MCRAGRRFFFLSLFFVCFGLTFFLFEKPQMQIVESAKLAMRYQNLPPVLNLCMDRSIPDQFTNEFDSVLGLAKPKASSSSSKFGATSTSSSSTNRR